METQSKNRDYSRLSLPAGASNSLCKTKGEHANPKQKSRLSKTVLCTANQVKFLHTGLKGPADLNIRPFDNLFHRHWNFDFHRHLSQNKNKHSHTFDLSVIFIDSEQPRDSKHWGDI
jgi:hypothetical protein